MVLRDRDEKTKIQYKNIKDPHLLLKEHSDKIKDREIHKIKHPAKEKNRFLVNIMIRIVVLNMIKKNCYVRI